MDEDAFCPVCEDVASDLVPLSCGHRPCKNCLTQHWRQRNDQVCPLCWMFDEPLPDLPRDRVPANQICDQHGYPLSGYCLKDKELVCQTCQLGSKHNGHEFCPVEQAAEERKSILRISMETLVRKLNGHKKACVTLNEMAQHVERQAQHTEREIKNEFEKLQRFLWVEKEARIAALKKEEKQKSQLLKGKIEKITKLISAVPDAISTIEQELEAEDISFLQNYLNTIKRTGNSLRNPHGMFFSIVTQSIHQLKSFFSTPDQIHNATVTRIYSTPLEPEPITNGLIDVAKHLGNLKYRVWKKMLGTLQYTPVTLDPNTAAPCLSLSEGLTSMKFCTDNPQLPDNPERVTFGAEILGSQCFTSGRHQWVVEVGDNSNWAVGVAKQSILRKDQTIQGQEVERTAGISALKFRNGRYATKMGPVSVQSKLRRVQVDLDWGSGNVTFHDSFSNRHIATIKSKFTEPVVPYFYSSCEEHPLQVAPEKVSITVGAPKKNRFFIFLSLILIFFLTFCCLTIIQKNLELRNGCSGCFVDFWNDAHAFTVSSS
ncbi:E3 ubiquitin-protein ligase TRIM35-like isoform X1 [Conger conger]|uniref:E3 ubiquitin-protein ligase TRIM35-like isoform X1 n=1 Tax=Conger conger TaxID=82655 RepID=UPI002A5AB6B0|nr:E3 ubiquitin-protein ligase TRIM35-like isoform X1 [Conger conger]